MAMFFKYPFATAGTRTTVPSTTQVDGSVSWQEGFGIDYQKVLGTDPDAKAIPRDKTNEILYELSLALQQYQTHGEPDWISSADNGGSPYSYDIYARVRYDAGSGVKVWESQVAANTSTPGADDKWAIISANSGGVQPGTIIDFAGTSAPTGYLVCDGSAVSRTTYASLFAAISTTWGVGDGSTTFNLPDLRRRTAVGSGGSGSAILGNAVGNTGGAETNNDIVDHTHNTALTLIPSTVTTGNNIRETGDVSPVTTLNAMSDSPTISPGSVVSAINIMQPSAVVLKCIKY